MEEFKTAVARAKEAGACRRALKELDKMSGWEEFFTHKEAPEWAYWYAEFIIRERFPEAELAIAQNAYWAYRYAMDVIRGRFPEAEPIIAQDACWAYWYSDYFKVKLS